MKEYYEVKIADCVNTSLYSATDISFFIASQCSNLVGAKVKVKKDEDEGIIICEIYNASGVKRVLNIFNEDDDLFTFLTVVGRQYD